MTASALPRSLTDPLQPPSGSSQDAVLVAGCRAGDPVAERALYQGNAEALYRIAYRLCGDPDLAADITQEAFVRAFAHLDQFHGASSLRTWLVAILVSSAGMVMRKGRWLRNHSSALDEQSPIEARDAGWSELAGHLDAAITALPDRLRAVVVMHDIEGFTHAEIGAALGIPPGTSKARLSGARAKLRAVLARHWRDRLL